MKKSWKCYGVVYIFMRTWLNKHCIVLVVVTQEAKKLCCMKITSSFVCVCVFYAFCKNLTWSVVAWMNGKAKVMLGITVMIIFIWEPFLKIVAYQQRESGGAHSVSNILKMTSGVGKYVS